MLPGQNLWFIYADGMFLGIGEMHSLEQGIIVSSNIASKLYEGCILELDAFWGLDAFEVMVVGCDQGIAHKVKLKKMATRSHQHACLVRAAYTCFHDYFGES
jgi:hypothetical protein